MYRIQSATLSGKLRAEFARKWSGSDQIWPSEQTIWRNILKNWRQNPHATQIEVNLFRPPPIRMVDLNRTLSDQAVRSLLRKLKKRETFYRALSEAKISQNDTKGLVCLIFGLGQATYNAFVMNSESDAESFQVVQVVITSAVSGSACEIEIQTNDGWAPVPPDEATNYPEVRAVLLTLKSIVEQPKKQNIPIEKLKFDPEIPNPPIDELLVQSLVDVSHGKYSVTHADAPFTLIRAYNKDYLEKLGKINLPTFPVDARMTLYWAGDHFVMSDDYALYLQHLKTGSDNVPAAIIGPYPRALANPICTGGPELVPPLIMFPSYTQIRHSDNDELWLLRERLRHKEKKAFPHHDLATWLVFAKLLTAPNLPERQLHDFIIEHPVLLAEFGTNIDSEVSLDGRFRIDLVAHRTGAMPQVWLIELERSDHQVLTQSGQEGAAVTHAVQQVSDWLRWWRNNSNHPFVKRYDAVTPQGIVVIGRTSRLTEDEISILTHNNQLRPGVKVITYDQLLDKFEEHLLAQIDDEIPPPYNGSVGTKALLKNDDC